VTIRSAASGNRASGAWLRALELTAPITRQPERTFPIAIQELAEHFGPAPALMSDGECLTYRALSERANQYSRWALDQGLIGGAVLGLLMPNCADYVAIWLGITRVGGVVALINTSLTGSALAHSIDVVSATHLIVAREYMDALLGVVERLQIKPKYWVHGGANQGLACIEDALQRCAAEPLQGGEHRPPTIHDRALYIYTSGTSGLAKAVNVSHFRVMQWTHWFAGLMDTQHDDRMYNCLPMYHSIGGVVAIGAPLVHGGAVVIRRRFSASEFWQDIIKSDCTLFQYIGELCRYLVNSPAQEAERQHRLRLCCGNGLRPEIWRRFKERFRVPQILEYYASTEGNLSLYNCEEKIGAIGRIPSLLRHRHAVALIQCDQESTEPIRNAAGLCCPCLKNEVGEAIAEVRRESSNPATQFEGYTDKEASSRKILRNVLAAGDSWYRTGDLMRQDSAGYFYFLDRIGDTFRWKGENVATSEVAECLRGFEGVTDAVVYGVKVPGTEGRAGMAALEMSGAIDLKALHNYVGVHLPSYARPLFVRVLRQIPVTATHKPRKVDLLRDGYDPATTDDPIFFDDGDSEAYIVVNDEIFQRVQSGSIRL
jgi:fatty-acyl-CoA synthase